VTLKAAQSLDGQIAAARGSSSWITGEASRRFAHRLRLGHDAVLVGAGTVRADDPRLTVRLPGVAAPRVRVVLSREGNVDARAKVFLPAVPAGPRTRLYVGPAARDRVEPLSAVADVVAVPVHAGDLDLTAVLADLSAAGVQSVLVEGGGRTLAAFVTAGLADELALFVAPSWIGARGATPILDLPAASSPARARGVDIRENLPIGRDRLLVGRLAPA